MLLSETEKILSTNIPRSQKPETEPDTAVCQVTMPLTEINSVSKICSYLIMRLFFPTFTLRREAGSVRPSKCALTPPIWTCHSKARAKMGCAPRPGAARGSQAGSQDGLLTSRSPGGTETAAPLSAIRGYRVGLSGKGLWRKGRLQSGGLVDREVRGPLCLIHTPLSLAILR